MTTHISARVAWHMDGWSGQARQKEIRSRVERNAAVWGLIPTFAWRSACRLKPSQQEEE